MTVQRRLYDAQERAVALSRLCGVRPEYLEKTWEISDATVRQSILDKRSREWKDPLVEFYRRTPKRRNATHLYLTFHHKKLPKGELIVPERDLQVYIAVENDIFGPLIEGVMKNTSLERFVAPSSSLERLLEAVCGVRSAWDIAESAALDKLHFAYQQRGSLQIGEAFAGAERTLIEKIKQGALYINSEKAKVIYDALARLSPRERDIIMLRFGLFNNPQLNYTEIAERYNLSCERVRQIEAKAFERLRHYSVSRRLKPIAGLKTAEEAFVDRKRDEWYQELYPVIEQDVISRIPHNSDLQRRIADAKIATESDLHLRSVDELELSLRPRRILSHAGISTLGQLVRMTDRDLYCYKGMGEFSINEIKRELNRLGLALKPVQPVVQETAVPEKPGAADIDVLKLNSGIWMRLRNSKIRTFEQLANMTGQQLQFLAGLDEASLQETREALAKHNMYLMNERPAPMPVLDEKPAAHSPSGKPVPLLTHSPSGKPVPLLRWKHVKGLLREDMQS